MLPGRLFETLGAATANAQDAVTVFITTLTLSVPQFFSDCVKISLPKRFVPCHTGLPYNFNFWHSGTLALSPERQSARMSEIRNYRLDQYGQLNALKCNHFSILGLKGLTYMYLHYIARLVISCCINALQYWFETRETSGNRTPRILRDFAVQVSSAPVEPPVL